jgi:hypothetical protein
MTRVKGEGTCRNKHPKAQICVDRGEPETNEAGVIIVLALATLALAFGAYAFSGPPAPFK